MRIFENKSIFKKLIIILLCIVLLSFCIPKTVKASDDGIGGKLLNPIMSFFVSLSDGAMSLLHKVVYHSDATLINIDTSADIWSKIIVIVAAVLIAAVAIAAVVFTGGGAAVVALGVIKVVLVVGAVTTITYPITTGLVEGMLPDSFYLPLYTITPQEIFSNEIPLLDVDFFNEMDSIKLEDGTTMESTAYQLKSTVSNWYIILRDISLVALLSVLVYIGIRILISSTANDKAKYKQMLLDWIVAICLLFVMQYIMAFSNLLVGKFIDVINTTKIDVNKDAEIKQPEMFDISDSDVVKKAYETLVSKPAEKGDISSEEDSPYYAFFVDDGGNTAGSSSTRLLWPAENFVQQARINLQLLSDKKETYVAIGWKLIYVVLVVMTFIFIFTYLKRVVYMTFLTVIAPLVALTYPIDKINDGKAQAFNMWFKEYIFNLLIQPMHLILYTILISSAMEFASQNILYVVVALGFMVPAEKLLRKFFGFEKAQTPGLLAGPAGAALMMNGMNKLLGKGPKGPGKHPSGKGENSDSGDDGKPPRVNQGFDKDEAIFGDGDDIPPLGDGSGGGDPPPLGGDSGGRNGYDNHDFQGNRGANTGYDSDDNIIDLSEDEYSITDANMPLLGDNSMSNSGSGTHGNNSNNGGYNNTYTPPRNSNDGSNSHTGTSGTNSSEVQNKKKLKKGHPLRQFGAAAGAAARYYARGSLRNASKGIANKVHNSHPIRTAAKIGTGVVGATALGTAGLIAGIASGDVTKAAQYTAAGAMGGYKVTSGIPDKIGSFAPEGVAEVAERARYDSEDEYDKKRQKDYIKQYQKNEKNMFELEKRYGRKQAKEIMKNDIPQFLDNGITDMKDISTIIDMKNDGNITDIDEGIALKKYSSMIGQDSTKMSSKKRKEWNDTFKDRFANNKKYKDQDPNDMAEKLFKKIDAYNKIRYSK